MMKCKRTKGEGDLKDTGVLNEIVDHIQNMNICLAHQAMHAYFLLLCMASHSHMSLLSDLSAIVKQFILKVDILITKISAMLQYV